MILTVTLNAALDVTYEVPRLVPYSSHRVSAVWRRGGGKGVNVARLLTALGEPVTATGLAGGATGDEVIDDLARDGVRARFHPVAGESRRCVTVVADGDATVFNEPGPVVSTAEWAGFQRAFARLVTEATEASRGVVVLSGSLPRGLTGSAYADLTAVAKAAGAQVVLDADGAALRAGLAGRPDVVKPNLAELARVLPGAGGAVPDPGSEALAGPGLPPDVPRAGAVLRTWGAGAVVVSRGPAGVVAVTPDGTWSARPPAEVAGNPTGAGDAVAAALARAMLRGTPWDQALADAVALSAATVLAPVAGAADLAAYGRWRPRIRVERLPEGENTS